MIMLIFSFMYVFFFSSRRRHTRCALVTGVQTCALPISSGHDSRQVILALNSAVEVLKRQNRPGADDQLVEMLESSAEYLNEIVSTTISGANIAASDSGFVALSSFRAEALVEPL